MRLLAISLLLAPAATAFPATYSVKYNDSYSYIVRVNEGRFKDIFIVEKSKNWLTKIPQTVQIDGRNFSILCDLKIKGPGGASGIGLVNLRGEVELAKDLTPKIGKSTGILLKK